MHLTRLLMTFIFLVTLSSGEISAQVLSLGDMVKAKVKNSKFITHTGYVCNFNMTTNTPNWVAWELTCDELNGKEKRKDYSFLPDPAIPERYQVCGYDYSGSGYDRGHMCPAGDMKWSGDAMRDCFYMTNICPQVGVVNQEYWERLETACRRWAKLYGSIYIVCGPIYSSKKYKVIGENQSIAVPDAFFKVVLCLQKGHEMGIGFYYSNCETRQTMESAARTIDDIEDITGYDFFPTLSKELEKSLESQCKLSIWK